MLCVHFTTFHCYKIWNKTNRRESRKCFTPFFIIYLHTCFNSCTRFNHKRIDNTYCSSSISASAKVPPPPPSNSCEGKFVDICPKAEFWKRPIYLIPLSTSYLKWITQGCCKKQICIISLSKDLCQIVFRLVLFWQVLNSRNNY